MHCGLLSLTFKTSNLESKLHPGFRMVHRLLSLNLWCESYSQNTHTDIPLPPLGSLAASLQDPFSCDWEILLEAQPDHPGHSQEDLRREGRGDLSFVQRTAGVWVSGVFPPSLPWVSGFWLPRRMLWKRCGSVCLLSLGFQQKSPSSFSQFSAGCLLCFLCSLRGL